ncbi:MAG: sodium:solute symporter family transporter [Candidatus Helarchaeota archaeon]
MQEISGTFWFWFAFAAYLVTLAVIGYLSHRKTKNITDFLVASRGIGTILLGLSYGVTYFSAVLLVGCPGLTWYFGEQWMWVTLMNVFFGTFIAFIILGNRTRRMSKKLGSLTLPEMIAERYQDERYIRPTAGLVLAVFQTIYLVSIFIGLSVLLQVLFPGFPYAFHIAVVLCGIVTASYLIIGGSHSAIMSDMIESIIMLVGVVGITIGGLIAVGGLSHMNANILADIANNQATGFPDPFSGDPAAVFIFPNIVSMTMIGMALVTTFGTWGSPQMNTRFFTSKDRRSIRNGMIIAIIWVFVVSFCAWFNGAVGRGLAPNSTEQLTNWVSSIGGDMSKWREYVMPWLLADQHILPLWFTALFLAAVTAASLTTGEKIIIVASGAISRDFWQKGIAKDKNISDEKTLKWTRIWIILIIIIAIFMTFLRPSFILDLCMFSWAALNAFTLIPYVAGLFWKGGTKKAALWSGIIAMSVAVFWFLFVRGGVHGIAAPFHDIPLFTTARMGTITLGSIHEFIMSQIVAIPSFFIISLLDKKNKPDKQFLDELFDYIKEDVND